MTNFLSLLSQCPLFEGLSLQATSQLLACIKPRQKKYAKNAFVLTENDTPSFVGIVGSGVLHIVRNDYWGNRAIVARLEPGEVFGEAFVCGMVKKLPVSVTAAEDSEVLFFDFNRIVSACSSACNCHVKLIKNMVAILAKKNIALMEKVEYVTQRNTRSKILSYLSAVAKRQNNSSIAIPFNRQELADYLSVERSALSAELCRMRNEGLLEFHKNRFRVLLKKSRDR